MQSAVKLFINNNNPYETLCDVLSLALQVVRRTILPKSPSPQAPAPRVRKVTSSCMLPSLLHGGIDLGVWFLWISPLFFNLLISLSWLTIFLISSWLTVSWFLPFFGWGFRLRTLLISFVSVSVFTKSSQTCVIQMKI